MQPRLLIVTGLPCSGETTLARRLAARFGYPLLEKDVVKEALFASLGSGDAAALAELRPELARGFGEPLAVDSLKLRFDSTAGSAAPRLGALFRAIDDDRRAAGLR